MAEVMSWCDPMDQSHQQLVATHVRNAIMTGRLGPGNRLMKQNLASKMQTSRGPADTQAVPWQYIAQHPQVAFFPNYPEYAKLATETVEPGDPLEKSRLPLG